jgi:membrane protein
LTEAEAPDAARPPEGPERLSAREWLAAGKRSGKSFLGDDGMGLAQQVAYSSILAFFPTLIFIVGLFGVLGIYETLRDFLEVIAPDAVLDALTTIEASAEENPTASLVAFVLGALGALWAASGAMNTVIKAVNRAYDTTDARPFWKKRLAAIVLCLAIAVVATGMLLLIVFGGPLGTAIAENAGLGGAFEWTWNILRWPLVFVTVLLFFALVYFLAPDTEQRNWRWVSPGALVGAIGWLVLSGLFALYVRYAGTYDETYGSLAAGIVLLLWLNYSAYALIFGAELNSELDRQADLRAAGGERAGLIEPARRTR